MGCALNYVVMIVLLKKIWELTWAVGEIGKRNKRHCYLGI